MNKTTPLVKGIITGIIMVILSLVFYYSQIPVESNLHYTIYILYALGIAWALIGYSRSVSYTGKFGDIRTGIPLFYRCYPYHGCIYSYIQHAAS
jgi:hypothetical protein